jgi:hypothetical protein
VNFSIFVKSDDEFKNSKRNEANEMSQTGEKLAKVRKGREAAKSWRGDEHFRGLPKPVCQYPERHGRRGDAV